MAKYHRTEIRIWSKSGVTPITNRGASYCDELYHEFLFLAGPKEAHDKVLELIETIPNGHYGHFNMPDWWNQNMREDYIIRGREKLYLGS